MNTSQGEGEPSPSVKRTKESIKQGSSKLYDKELQKEM
jgi:hypothetical protein